MFINSIIFLFSFSLVTEVLSFGESGVLKSFAINVWEFLSYLEAELAFGLACSAARVGLGLSVLIILSLF